jgi:hypothetical protein
MPFLMRWCARAAGAVVVVTWIELVLFEIVRYGPPDPQSYFQAAALALVFAGYGVGWRHELAGGVLSIVGTVALAVICTLMFAQPPSIALAWFAVPGVLYLLAWHNERQTSPVA